MSATFTFYLSTSEQTALFDTVILLDNFCSFAVVPPSAPPQRSVDQRSTPAAPSAPAYSAPATSGEPNSLTPAGPYAAAPLLSQTENENEGHLNPTEKLQ